MLRILLCENDVGFDLVTFYDPSLNLDFAARDRSSSDGSTND